MEKFKQWFEYIVIRIGSPLFSVEYMQDLLDYYDDNQRIQELLINKIITKNGK